jgi:hypothetical protein
MTGPRPDSQPRRSLRQILKNFLQRFPGRPDRQSLLGSGILRRADIHPEHLPHISTVSLFPDFGSDDFDDGQIPAPTPNTAVVEQLLTVPNTITKSPRSLLPSTSLSQFNLRDSYAQKSTSAKPITYHTVDEAYLSGASRQASVATLSTNSIRRSVSTLRLVASSDTPLTSLYTASQETIRTSGLRSKASRRTLDKPQAHG